MAEHKRQIKVVSFAAQAFVTGPCGVLEELGYAITGVCGSRPEDCGASQDTDVFAVVCDPGYSSLDEIEAFLARGDTTRTLGIVYCQSDSWKTEILERFTEFVAWPSYPCELETRLNRLFRACSSEACKNDPNVTEAFLGLNLNGGSPAFLEMLTIVRRLARYDAPVLIQGETGSGKELVARALHFLSVRRDHAFIPVNCGAIPDNLFENELYGHQKGAFTDAKETQAGLVELADKGILFLDEAESLTPKAQVALLRFLDSQEYKPLGGGVVRKADLRLVVATNKDLQHLAEAGSFRTDLLFRLNVAIIRVPPLRLRRDDIELLARHFLEIYSAKYGLSQRTFSQELLFWMGAYDWPGNVRELENFVQRVLMMSDGSIVHFPASEIMPTGITSESHEQPMALFDADLSKAKVELVNRFEERYLRRLMVRTGGNVTLAARLAGKERRSFGKMLKKHGIERENYFTAPQDPSHN